jgi:hypothetical protein
MRPPSGTDIYPVGTCYLRPPNCAKPSQPGKARRSTTADRKGMLCIRGADLGVDWVGRLTQVRASPLACHRRLLQQNLPTGDIEGRRHQYLIRYYSAKSLHRIENRRRAPSYHRQYRYFIRAPVFLTLL